MSVNLRVCGNGVLLVDPPQDALVQGEEVFPGVLGGPHCFHQTQRGGTGSSSPKGVFQTLLQ